MKMFICWASNPMTFCAKMSSDKIVEYMTHKVNRHFCVVMYKSGTKSM